MVTEVNFSFVLTCNHIIAISCILVYIIEEFKHNFLQVCRLFRVETIWPTVEFRQ